MGKDKRCNICVAALTANRFFPDTFYNALRISRAAFRTFGGYKRIADEPVSGRFVDDPFVAAACPECGTRTLESVIEGIGEKGVRCKRCNTDSAPLGCSHAD